ncbi:MAG: hypothetical protein IJF82_08500 [Achromobacter sp.]|nr:hypothetical protein [Achromobacter sp.]
MQPPSWQVLGRGGSGVKQYEIEGLAGPNGISVRLVSGMLPPIEVQGLFTDVAAAVEAAKAVAEDYFGG